MRRLESSPASVPADGSWTRALLGLRPGSSRPYATAAEMIEYGRERGLYDGFEPVTQALLVVTEEWPRILAERFGEPTKHLFELDVYEASGFPFLVLRATPGSQMAAHAMEKLAALGVRRVVALGHFGGLDPRAELGDIVVVGRAFPGETISAHYGPADRALPAATGLRAALEAALEEYDNLHGFSRGYFSGSSLSTDSFFREPQARAELARAGGITALESEAAALYAAGRALGVAVVSMGVVSNLFRDQGWTQDYFGAAVHAAKVAMADVAVRALAETAETAETPGAPDDEALVELALRAAYRTAVTSPAPPQPGRRVVILGGGSAGYLAALAFRAQLPELEVVVVESPDIPIIRVGEATTPLMVAFLHRYLGLDVSTLYREVQPTWKLGVRLFWGAPGDSCFNYPFDARWLGESVAYEGDINSASLGSLLMTARKGPILEVPGRLRRSLLREVPFAYHLENARFVAYLVRQATARGVRIERQTIDEVELAADGSVRALRTRDRNAIGGDFFIDATGFRGHLIAGRLGSPFVSYGSSLFTDTAVCATVPNGDEIGSYTLAETMSSGWCWRIPHPEETHRGYVFSSEFQSLDHAVDEMRRANPEMGEPWIVQFRSGRRQDFCKHNVAAIGNAYGFVEPLESTALHMVIREVTMLIGAWPELLAEPRRRELLNRRVGDYWDYFRGLLAMHYRFNRKLDTPFWRACRADTDLAGAEEWVALAEERAPISSRRFGPELPAPAGLVSPALDADILLLGQGVVRVSAPIEDREAWQRRLAYLRGLANRCLGHGEALRRCAEHPELVEGLVAEPSWIDSIDEGFGRPAGRRGGPT